MKDDWSDFLVISVSNNFPNKLVILESYDFSPINTSRIGLFSKLEMLDVFKVNKTNFLMA